MHHDRGIPSGGDGWSFVIVTTSFTGKTSLQLLLVHVCACACGCALVDSGIFDH